LQYVAVGCSGLQCVAVCCSALTACCSVLQCAAVRCSVSQCVTVLCSALQRPTWNFIILKKDTHKYINRTLIHHTVEDGTSRHDLSQGRGERGRAWSGDRHDRGKNIGAVTTGPDFRGFRLGLILTRARPSREVGSILMDSRGSRKKDIWACTRRRAPADGVIEHLQHTHIPQHTRTHAHTVDQRNTRARAYTMILCN